MTTIGLILSLFLITEQTELSYQVSEGIEGQIPKVFYELKEYDELDHRGSYWVKATLEAQEEGDYILKGGQNYMQCMLFFDKNGQEISLGNQVELSLKKKLTTIYIYYPFLDPKEKKGISLELYRSNDFHNLIFRDKIINVAFIGILLFVCFLSLAFHYTAKRYKDIYLKYSLYLLAIFCFFAYQFGTIGSFFSGINEMHPTWAWVFSSIIGITYGLFIQSFLVLKKTEPSLNQIINYGILVTIFTILVEVFSFIIEYDIHHSLFYTVVSVGIQSVLLTMILYKMYHMESTLSKITFVGVLILVLTSLIAQWASTFKMVEETNYLIMTCIVMEVFVFNVRIGNRMLLINEEKRNAQDELIEQLKLNEHIQEQNNLQLEQKVEERTEELRVKNKQNEMLLGEIHHRVKNNLQTITSLLSIQQRKLKDSESVKVIQDSKNRVIAMGLIHEHLYQNASFAEIDFKNYVKELIDALLKTYTSSKIGIEISIPTIKIDVDNAIFLGLIINELVNNSIKHAFDGAENPFLQVSIFESAQEMVLMVKDNGTKEDVNFNSSKSFGWKMVNSICQKLGGRLEVDNSNGLSIQVHFNSDLVELT